MQLEINSFIYNQKKFVSSNPILFEAMESSVKEDNDIKTFYSIENEDFNIEAFGDTIEELKEDLLSEMSFNWETYALTNPEHLSDKAKAVRENYLKTFKESL